MVFIAAEIGVNWRNLTEARRMIGLARDAGADAVKFQCYQERHVRGHPREEELVELILEQPYLQFLKDTADECGIEFFATPYYPEAVEKLEAVGVKRYKIRYADCNNYYLINKAVEKEKPVYVSWDGFPGAIQDKRIELKHREGMIHFIYCVPKYPPEIEEILLKQLSFHSWYGYSNHYPSIVPSLFAASRGARYIEVHVKLDKYPDGYKPIDDAASITFSQLAELCRLVREIEKMRG